MGSLICFFQAWFKIASVCICQTYILLHSQISYLPAPNFLEIDVMLQQLKNMNECTVHF